MISGCYGQYICAYGYFCYCLPVFFLYQYTNLVPSVVLFAGSGLSYKAYKLPISWLDCNIAAKFAISSID